MALFISRDCEISSVDLSGSRRWIWCRELALRLSYKYVVIATITRRHSFLSFQ